MIEYGRDPAKEAENVRQHGITFNDAIVALQDRFAIEWFGEDHSIEEPRFVTIGRDLRGSVPGRGNLGRLAQATHHFRTARHEARTTCV